MVPGTTRFSKRIVFAHSALYFYKFSYITAVILTIDSLNDWFFSSFCDNFCNSNPFDIGNDMITLTLVSNLIQNRISTCGFPTIIFASFLSVDKCSRVYTTFTMIMYLIHCSSVVVILFHFLLGLGLLFIGGCWVLFLQIHRMLFLYMTRAINSPMGCFIEGRLF